MQNIQLYIEGQRIDLFKDESVTITDTIKNVKDVSKVFTEFSKTFSLPASKINNKIFKHYYNNDIVNGYDARVRVKANIELNFLPFKDGYIKLEGVDLKDNKAHTYRITFFGNTVSLKNIIGDDSLTDLGWLINFNTRDNGTPIVYKQESILEYLTNKISRTVDGITYNEPLQIPLLTHTQRLYYDSSEHIADRGNLWWHPGGGTNKHGVVWNELKFSIKILVIIKAIEKQYNITFSNDFFNNDNKEINKLYMWLHRNKGKITKEGQTAKTVNTFPDTTLAASSTRFGYLYSIRVPDDQYYNTDFSYFRLFRLYFRPKNGYETVPYKAILYKDGNVYWSSDTLIGDNTRIEVEPSVGDYTMEIITEQDIIFDEVAYQLRSRYGIYEKVEEIFSDEFEVTTEFEYNVLQQLPKMKTLDFLTGLFKMYNLVTYLDNGIIVVQKLEDYYSKGKNYDITKYIDVSKSQSNAALPFREIEYSYKGLKTFFASTHEQLFGKSWGTEEFKNNDTTKFSGGIFKQDTPFEHTKFERLIDVSTKEQKNIQWGWSVDDNQESYIGNPLLFYLSYADTQFTSDISFVTSINADGEFGNNIAVGSCFLPQNSSIDVNDLYSYGNSSINFKQEIDEWLGVVNYNTLFKNCHISYMKSIFDQSNRLTKLKAYLPLSVLLNYKLNDTFKISDKIYKINSIKTNFQNGESELELLNNYEQEFTINHSEREISNLNFIFVDWNIFFGASTYKYYINDWTPVTLTANNFNRFIGASVTELIIFVEALDSNGNILKKSNTLTVQV